MIFRSSQSSAPPANVRQSPTPRFRRALTGAAAAVVVLAVAACSPAASIENADVPAWKATALPAAAGIVLEDAGKILNRDPIVRAASTVPVGTYTLTMTCDGGGKAFFTVSLDGKQLAEAGAACNGSREMARVNVPAAGEVKVSTSSVDAPLLYAYHLTVAG